MYAQYFKSAHGRIAFPGVMLLALSAGCGSGDGESSPAVDVSGVITLNGQPLGDAEVYFMTDAHTGYGRTDSEGRFTLVQGAAPGENRVCVTKLVGGEGVDPDPAMGMDMEQFQAAALGAADPSTGRLPPGTVLPEQVVPAEYSDPEHSRLTFDVPMEGTDAANFRF